MDKKNTSNLKQQLIIAMTLSSLFGLGWGIGLLATQDIYSNKTVHNMVAALFILLTTFHGVFIFIMHCLRSEKVRKVWKKWFFVVIVVSDKSDTKFLSGNKDATLESKSTSGTKEATLESKSTSGIKEATLESNSTSGTKEATLESNSTSGIKEATLQSVPGVDSSIEEAAVSHNIETCFT